MKSKSYHFENHATSLGLWHRVIILFLMSIGSASIYAQTNATEFANLTTVTYDDCTGIANVRFPINEDWGNCFQADQLRWIDVFYSEPDGSETKYCSMYKSFLNFTGNGNSCPAGSVPFSPSVCSGDPVAYYSLCAFGGASTHEEVGTGWERYMRVEIPWLSNESFGTSTTFRFEGRFNDGCCWEWEGTNGGSGYNFNFSKTAPGGPQASIGTPSISSSMASDCRTATISWNSVSPPGNCGTVAYEVRRDGSLILGTTSATTFVDDNFGSFLTPGDSYQYEVRAKWTPSGSTRLNSGSWSGLTPAVNIPLENGMISGTVKSAGGIPLQGVAVTATRIATDPTPECLNYGTPTTLTATTDGNGFYQMENIYYGHPNDIATIYNVSAISGGNPTSNEDVVLDDASPNGSADLVDSTSFIVTGRVLSANGCGVANAAITADGLNPANVVPILPDTTDANGDFTLAVPGADNYQITSTYVTPNNVVVDDITINVNTNPFNGADIQYSRTNIVQGFVGGSCNAIFGPATVTAYTKSGCNIASTTSDAVTGMYTMTLPAIEMDIKVEGYNPTMGPLFGMGPLNQTQEIALDSTTTLDFIFRVPIVVDVIGIPEQVCSDITYPIMDQFRPYPLIYVVTEGANCPVDTGFIVVTDNVGSTDAMPLVDTIWISNGVARDTIVPGAPNIFADYSKSLFIEAFAGTVAADIVIATPVSISAVVTGSAPRGRQFTTVSPQIPRLIIRDPPGGASFSEITQSSTFSTSSSLYTQNSVGGSVWAKAKVGVEIDIISFEAGIEIGANFGGESININSEETLYEFTAESTYSTSDDPDITGEDGDVYVGAAMNLTYANSDIISLDLASCSIDKTVELVISPDSFETEFVYAEADIVNLIIPSLQAIVDDETQSQSDRHRSREGIRIWNQIMNLNAELKEEAFNGTVLPLNQSFGGSAGPHSQSFTTTTTETRTVEWKQLINQDIAVEAGFSLAGSGLSAGFEINLKQEFGGSTTNGISTSTTVGFTFDDDDPTDLFTVDYAIDPVFGTPVFRAAQNAGNTSCPWELGAKVHKPYFDIATPVKYAGAGINTLNYTFVLGNQSETGYVGEYADYQLRLETNPKNADVKVFGTSGPVWIINDMPLGNQNISVSVERPPANEDYHFEGLLFSFAPVCDPAQAIYIPISAFFESPCSEIGINIPTVSSGFVINEASNNTRNIQVGGYDYNSISPNDAIVLEYAVAGTHAWNNSNIQLTKNGLVNNNPARTNVTWNTANIPDGAYDIRTKLTCTSGGNSTTTTSTRVSGIIDRLAPQVFGIPFPQDDDYASGDTIAVIFDEMLDCTNTTVTLTMLPDNITVPVTFNCINKTLSVSPSYDISVEIGKTFEVMVDGLEDLYGNEIDQAYTWEFTVGEIDSDGNGYNDTYELCIGSALHFDGIDDYVSIPFDPSLNITSGDFTIEAWINPSNSSGFQTVFSKGLPIIVTLTPFGGPYIGAIEFYFGGNFYSVGPTIPRNKWSHIALSYDAANKVMTTYVDGAHSTAVNITGTPITSSAPIYFGRTVQGTSWFNGRIDDVMLWEQNLTQAEIRATMSGKLTGSETDLVAYYDFNDAESCQDNAGQTTLNDAGSASHDGTLINFLLDGCQSSWGTERSMDNDRDGVPDGCDEIEPCFDSNDTGDTDGDLGLACADLCPTTKDVALDFDGETDFLVRGSSPALSFLQGDFTFEAWINPKGNFYEPIFDGYDGTAVSVVAFDLRYAKIALFLRDMTDTVDQGEYLFSTTDVPLNQWSHVAVSFDASTKKATFYLNGEHDGERQSELPTIDYAPNMALYLGNRCIPGESCGYFDGRMDDLTVWERTLSEYNINQSMAAPLSGLENGLSFFLDLNEGTACADNSSITSVADKSVNGLNFNLANFDKAGGCTSNWVPGRNLDSDGDMIGDACDSSGFGCPPNYAGANKLIGDQEYNTFFDADGAIESNQLIKDPAGVIYNSSTSVELLPDFEVELGSTLEVKLDGCPD